MITLYDYQEKFIGKVRKWLKKGLKHLLCQSPTGSGKTVMFSWLAWRSSNKDKKTLIVTDRVELLFQAGGTIEQFDFYPYYIKAGTKYIDRERDVYIAMSQTLRNRLKSENWYNFIRKEIDLVIIDEAHIQEFNHIFESGVLDDKIVLGFTATPHRTGKMRQLGMDYERIIQGPTVRELVEIGRLVNCDIYDCGSPDMSGVSFNYAKGDYAEGAMFQRFDTAKLYQGLVRNYKKYTPGQKMIVFCCNVEHAIKTTIELADAGIDARFVCSKPSKPKPPANENPAAQEKYRIKKEAYERYIDAFEKHSGPRDEIFAGFQNSDFDVLVNVDIATKGYDCKDIEVVALYRATMSLTLYLQMLGRGGRTADGKSHFTVFDFGGNKARFGEYDANRTWSLWHETSKEGGTPPLKLCGLDSKGRKIPPAGEIQEGCERMIHASLKICPFCGFKYKERTLAEEIDLQLSEYKDEKGVTLKEKSLKDMNYDELTKYRAIKKHKMAWMWRQLWMRGGEEELRNYAQKYRWRPAQVERAVTFCKRIYEH